MYDGDGGRRATGRQHVRKVWMGRNLVHVFLIGLLLSVIKGFLHCRSPSIFLGILAIPQLLSPSVGVTNMHALSMDALFVLRLNIYPLPANLSMAGWFCAVLHIAVVPSHVVKLFRPALRRERDQLRSTKITESPRRNILLTNRSLVTGFPFFPAAVRGVSVHISFAFSSTMLK